MTHFNKNLSDLLNFCYPQLNQRPEPQQTISPSNAQSSSLARPVDLNTLVVAAVLLTQSQQQLQPTPPPPADSTPFVVILHPSANGAASTISPSPTTFAAKTQNLSGVELAVPQLVQLPPPLPALSIAKGSLARPESLKKAQLWDFLLDLLQNELYRNCIAWTGVNYYEFKFIQPAVVAHLWGARKNSQRMSYEKLSRSLRYYYNKNIIVKSSSERYTYRYTVDTNNDLRRYIDYRRKWAETRRDDGGIFAINK